MVLDGPTLRLAQVRGLKRDSCVRLRTNVKNGVASLQLLAHL